MKLSTVLLVVCLVALAATVVLSAEVHGDRRGEGGRGHENNECTTKKHDCTTTKKHDCTTTTKKPECTTKKHDCTTTTKKPECTTTTKKPECTTKKPCGDDDEKECYWKCFKVCKKPNQTTSTSTTSKKHTTTTKDCHTTSTTTQRCPKW